MSPTAATHPLTSTHRTSPSRPLRPRQTLPDPILFLTISYHFPDVRPAPWLLHVCPTLPPMPAPKHTPLPPHRLAMLTLAKSRAPVSHTCVANPYDLIHSSHETHTSATITSTSLAHRPVPLLPLPHSMSKCSRTEIESCIKTPRQYAAWSDGMMYRI